ncbi:helix-turn-helix domain-containing protein [Saccharopolyspora spinosa]|uniref:helix-turn-helix domain-containing protein n=1 Tax=Saccharopolyspora spinosa TaxID=60894 RepID=UPI000237AE66|nr:helix-turn-helix domain-containing protein [Saccharopolyspora spinosa]
MVGAYGLTADYIEHLNSDRPLHFRNRPDDSYGPSVRGFRSGRSVVVHDTHTDPAFAPWRGLAEAEGYRSLLAVPIVASGAPLGVLICYCDEPGQAKRARTDLIESLANHAGVVLEGYQLRRNQESAIAELQAALTTLDQNRKLHAHMIELVLRGARPEEVLAVLGKALDLEVRFETVDRAAAADALRVSVAGADIGWLVTDRPLTAHEHIALEFAGLVIALDHQRRASIYEAETRHKLDLLTDILAAADGSVDCDELLDRCLRSGFEMAPPHRVLVIAPDRPAFGAARRLERLAARLVPEARPHALTSYRQDVAVVLVPSAPAYDRYLEQLHVAATREIGGVSFSAVLGAECHRLGDYAPAYRTALAALRLRQRSGSVSAAARLEELGTLQFLLSGPPDELIAFSRRLLDPVREHSAELLPTLRAYLNNHQRAGATARELNVHPNTITNRMERISKVTGGSIEDTGHLLDLKLAILVADVVTA